MEQRLFFSPAADLEYDGGNDGLFIFKNTRADGRTSFLGGNVGVGTDTPRAVLDVSTNQLSNHYGSGPNKEAVVGVFRGGVQESDGQLRARFIIEGSTDATSPSLDFRINDPSGNVRGTHLYYAPNGFGGLPEHFGIWTHGLGTALAVHSSTNNIGIGTPIPNEKLTVATPGGGTPVGAMSIDVGTFGTNANAQNSYYFRVRDIGASSTPFYVRGDGNVGIGTTNPTPVASGGARTTLHVAGPLTPALVLEQINAVNPDKWAMFISSGTGGLIIRDMTSTPPTNRLSIFKSNTNNPANTIALDVVGDIQLTGMVRSGGGKGGYVVDRFVNNVGEVLEEGDVVVIGKNQASVYYGMNNNIPIPEVDVSQCAYDTRVCGIVCEIYTESKAETRDEMNPGPLGKKTPERSETPGSQSFTAEELSQLDRTKIAPGQVGWMVTLGAFAHCKVDADIAPIKVGDLLTTSPTKGHAQKVKAPGKAAGSILGKALGSLRKGKGKIPVLVMFQ